MEQYFSKSSFRKFRSTSRGCPVFRKFGISRNCLFHWAFLLGLTLGPATQGDFFHCSVFFFACDDLEFFLRHIFVDECRNIVPAVGKSKTKLNDSSNTLIMCTEPLCMYEFLPIRQLGIFLVCGTEFVFLI